jgi:hypothetical protein
MFFKGIVVMLFMINKIENDIYDGELLHIHRLHISSINLLFQPPLWHIIIISA